MFPLISKSLIRSGEIRPHSPIILLSIRSLSELFASKYIDSLLTLKEMLGNNDKMSDFKSPIPYS